MIYFLAKTEPSTYSIDDLKKDGTTTWNGVRNPTAVRFLKAMKAGDRVLIYHSGEEKAIVGLAKVTGNSRPDPDDTRSWLVDFKYLQHFSKPHITLKQIKESSLFVDLALVKQGRLSVMLLPVELIDWLEQSGYRLS